VPELEARDGVMSNTIEVEATTEADVQCECGADIDAGVEHTRHGTILITVDACTVCTDKAHDDGYEEGLEEAEVAAGAALAETEEVKPDADQGKT